MTKPVDVRDVTLGELADEVLDAIDSIETATMTEGQVRTLFRIAKRSVERVRETCPKEKFWHSVGLGVAGHALSELEQALLKKAGVDE